MDMFGQDSGADDFTSTFFPADDSTGDGGSGDGQGGDDGDSGQQGGNGGGPNGQAGDDGDSGQQGGNDGGPNGPGGGDGGQTTPPETTPPAPNQGPPSPPLTDPPGSPPDSTQAPPSPPFAPLDRSSSEPQVQTLWGSVDASNLTPNAFGGPDVLGASNADVTATDWQNEPFSSQFVLPPPPPPMAPPLPMPAFQPFGDPFGGQDMLSTNLDNISAMNRMPPPVTDPMSTDSATGPAVYGVATAQGTINTVDPMSDPSYMGPGTFFTPSTNPPPDAASLAV